ncbi:MAG: hypothetical protein JXA50_07685 [Deltaproteobacteria bacterium]|nr:hypothetical protein [Deltaproteobacteria bacterium]
MQTDISNYEQIKRIASKSVKAFGQFDILVNNAAAYSYNKTIH